MCAAATASAAIAAAPGMARSNASDKRVDAGSANAGSSNPADLNGDGMVDGSDLATLLILWGSSAGGVMTENGWYDSGSQAHLTDAGYDALSGLEVNAIFAPTSPAISHPLVAEAFNSAAQTERVAVVMIGDSNQLRNGTGWDENITKAIFSHVPLYATHLIAGGENRFIGANVGYKCGMQVNPNAWNTAGASSLSAPAFQDKALPGTAPAYLDPSSYVYLEDNESLPFNHSGSHGFKIQLDHPINPMAALRFHYVYGVFGVGNGSFWPAVRKNGTPNFGPIAASPSRIITADDGASISDAIVTGELNIPASDAPRNLNFRWVARSGVGAEDLQGPFIGYWMQAENPAILTGASCHTLIGQGGWSLRDMLTALQSADDLSLITFFNHLRNQIGPSKTILFRINSGLNDRNETQSSLGPNPTLPGDSQAAFEDNLQGIINRIRGVYSSQGWDPNELIFDLAVSHPTDPADAKLVSYRQAAVAIANANSGCFSLDFPLLLTSVADINNDGVVNGADLALLLVSWSL